MASTLPTRRRFVLVQGVLMYGVGLSILFTIAMSIVFREHNVNVLECMMIGLAVLIPIGALWAYFYYEHVARRYYHQMARRDAQAKSSE